ncbi:MAG: outer membrane protein assembly factor BamB family protein, partial [Tepidisphaeraceae bacterium]
LKLSDGSFQWSSYIASTSANSPLIDLDENGRISSGMTAQVAMADDRLYVLTNQGAVACLDASDGKTLWLDLYPRNVSPQRARQPFLRSEQTTKPFAINPPIVSGGRVFVMPSDSGSVLVYDANTGDTIATLPRKLDMKYEPADMLLAAVGDRVVMGNRSMVFVAPWRNFDPLKSLLENGGMYRNFTASDAAESDAIRGRPFVSEKYVLIPTADKLYRMTLNQFKFESVYPAEGKWDDDESPGNVVATPDNLIIAGPTRVTAYADLTVATAKLDTRIAANPEDVEAYLHYGELLFAAGRPLDAIGRLDQAIAHMGGAGKLSSGPLRDRLFEILCTAATKVQKNDTPSPQVLSELFDRAKLAAATPQQQVRYRLTQAAYFRKTGDADAEIALDQQILADPALRSASASDKNGMSTAGAIAENAINELIQLHGQQVYAAYESQAYQRLTAAKQATAVDPETLLAIADEFPASQQALDALTLASDRFEQLHEPRQATQTLRRLLKRGLSNERKLLVLEALARNYLAVPNQLDMAIVRLRQAKAITADAKLDRPLTLGDGRTLNDMTLAQAVVMLQQYRDTAIKASLPRVGLVATADGGDPGKPVFATPIDLGPAASVVRQQDDLGRNDRVVVLTPDNSIVAYDTTSAKPLMLPVAFGETPLGCGYVGNTLVVIGPTHAVAIDAGGKTLWQVALNSL